MIATIREPVDARLCRDLPELRARVDQLVDAEGQQFHPGCWWTEPTGRADRVTLIIVATAPGEPG